MNSLKSTGIVSVLLLSLGLAACGGGSSMGKSSRAAQSHSQPGAGHQAPESGPNAFPESSPAPAAESGGDYSAEGSAPTQAPASAGAPAAAERSASKAGREVYDAEPERPGLGTTWGETRSSRVSSSAFERESPSSPFAVTMLHYNDRNGINAMLRGASFSDFRSDGIPAARGMVTVRLVDEGGAPLPALNTGGRNLVVGEHGQRYVIELQNHTDNRLEAVVTVDGLDVIDGRPGNLNKRGYLLNPYATVEIDGFRQSMDEVAAFRFGSVRNSYAGKKGDDRNVGVIGVALFDERGANLRISEEELQRRNRANPFPGGFAQPPIAR